MLAAGTPSASNFRSNAWIMGSGDMKKMEEGVMDPEGKSNTQVGKILGIVATILLAINVVVALMVFVGMFVFAAGAAAGAGVSPNFNQPSALGIHAMNLELASNVDWPLITRTPTRIKTTPETTSTLCKCLRKFL